MRLRFSIADGDQQEYQNREGAGTSDTVIRVASVEQPGSGTVTVAGVVVVQDAIRSFLGKDYQFKTVFYISITDHGRCADKHGRYPGIADPELPAHSCKGLLVCSIVVDLKLTDTRFRVLHPYIINEGFYLLAMAAPVTIEKNALIVAFGEVTFEGGGGVLFNFVSSVTAYF